MLRSNGQRPDQGYDEQVPPIFTARVRVLDNFPPREAKRNPEIVVVHRRPPCEDDYGEEVVRGAPQGVRESRQVVVPSPVVREESMEDIAQELQKVVFESAGPITPGMGIKAQINAACDNLGYPRGYWRVREAWYGKASNWQGKAIFDLLGRRNRYLAKIEGRHLAANDTVLQAAVYLNTR